MQVFIKGRNNFSLGKQETTTYRKIEKETQIFFTTQSSQLVQGLKFKPGADSLVHSEGMSQTLRDVTFLTFHQLQSFPFFPVEPSKHYRSHDSFQSESEVAQVPQSNNSFANNITSNQMWHKNFLWNIEKTEPCFFSQNQMKIKSF